MAECDVTFFTKLRPVLTIFRQIKILYYSCITAGTKQIIQDDHTNRDFADIFAYKLTSSREIWLYVENIHHHVRLFYNSFYLVNFAY